jgi:hypothetical protein
VRKLLARWPSEKVLRVACVIGLVALALMVWGVLDGSSLPVVASMSIAQGVGVLAGALFGFTVLADGLKK